MQSRAQLPGSSQDLKILLAALSTAVLYKGDQLLKHSSCTQIHHGSRQIQDADHNCQANTLVLFMVVEEHKLCSVPFAACNDRSL